MRVTCMLNTSINGLIARLDGQEDFLCHDNWLDFLSAAKDANNFVIGRNTFDVVARLYEGFGFDDVQAAHKVIVTRNADWCAPEGYIVVNSPQAAIDYLRGKHMEQLLLVGGAGLNTSFAQAGLIDELVITLEPVVLGNGINLFAPRNFDLPLRHIKTEVVSNGRTRLAYAVKPAESKIS